MRGHITPAILIGWRKVTSNGTGGKQVSNVPERIWISPHQAEMYAKPEYLRDPSDTEQYIRVHSPTGKVCEPADSPTVDAEKQARDLVDAFRFSSPPVQSLRFLEWEPLVAAIANALRSAASLVAPQGEAHRCPHCGRHMQSDFDPDVGMWYACDNCDYREAVSTAAPAPSGAREDDPNSDQ